MRCLMSTVFSAKRRSQIAAALAAHGGSTPLALAYDRESQTEHGVSQAELERNRDGYSEDPLTEAALRFAHAALVTRGRLEPRDVRAAERRGVGGEDLAALTALAAQIAAEIITVNADESVGHRFHRWSIDAGRRLLAP
jgi:hypothetical protein